MNRFFHGLTALALFAALSAAANEGALRRVALAIGSHDGKGRERLMYAGSDAAAFRRTLEELGGLRRGDATLLIDPDSLRVLRALDDLEDRVRTLKREGARVEALVYYSGHANEKGLLLGRQSVDYRLFRTRMNGLGADVRIAVVDACESGALTRLKGGRSAPAFLVDKSTRSEGYAILTSSSESEAAQESDRVGGSFFTHALNSGLRGAADASRDGKVTLHEAYQFAYNETLARTESTRGGPQHAGYDIQLNGSGDVVLTDLRQGSAFLDLEENLNGRLFVRDSTGHLAVELQKPVGREMRIGLSPGEYSLRLLNGSRWSTATVTLKRGQASAIAAARFKPLTSERTALRGEEDSTAHFEDEDSTFHQVPNTAPGGFSSAILYDWVKTEWRGVQLAPIGTGAASHLRGGQLALGFNTARGDVEGFQAAIGANIGMSSLHGMQFSSGANILAKDLRGAQFGPGANVAGGHVTGFQGSVGANVAGEGVEGWQVAVGGNLSGNGVKGGQAAVGFNIAADSVKGLQGAVGFNLAADSVQGAQLAVGFNTAAGKVYGGQGAVGFNIAAGGVKGGQGAVGFNIAGGPVEGGQGAVGLNVAGGVRGGQGAVGANVAMGPVRGAQAAVAANAASALNGAQVALFLNIAGKVNGMQIGLVNLSDEYESGVPIGLLNVSRKGSYEFETWVEESGTTFAGLRTGVRWMHSHLAVGTKPGREGPALLIPTLGVSGEFPLGVPRLHGELGAFHSMVFMPEKPTVDGDFNAEPWSRARLGVGYKPLSFLTLFGGLTYNVSAHEYGDAPFTGNGTPFFRTLGDEVSLWPGAYVGLRLGK